MNELEALGKWWLPHRPDKQVIGTLRFHPLEGAKLDLDGLLPEVNFHSPEVDVILGDTRQGKITLSKCFWTLINPPKSNYFANIVYVGSHFERVEDIQFQYVIFSYPGLEQWLDPDWLERNRDKVPFTYPGDIDINGLRISFNDVSERKGISNREFTIRHTASVKITAPSESNLDEYRDHSFLLQAFLSIAMGRGIFPSSVQGKVKDSCKSDEKETTILQARTSEADLSDINPHRILLSFNDISDRFGDYLRNWFGKRENLKISLQLYMSLFTSPSLPLENRFLNLFQALESYHRRFYEGRYLSSKEYGPIYASLVESIPSGISEPLKERIKNGMRYFHEFSLRKRMFELAKQFDDPVSLFIQKGDMERLLDARNFYTHYDPESDSKGPDKLGLYICVKKLKMLLETCFLSEEGLSTKEIKEFIARSWNLKEILHLESRRLQE